MEKMVIKEKKGISPIWILPLVALCIGGWLLFKGVRDAGIDIQVYLDDASGISAGKTQVIYKGIPVGLVQKVEVDQTLSRVVAHIEMVKESKDRLVEDMKFWVVRPEVSADRITGLDTLMGGSYIGVRPGNSTVHARVFEGLPEAPPLPADTPGLRLNLLSHDSGSMNVSNPVYYKKIKVGEIISVDFAENHAQVKIGTLIYKKYANLVNSSTVFWNMSGIIIDANLNRINIRTGTLSTLLSGGIAFDTRLDGSKIDPKQVFKLYESQHEAKLSRGAKLTLHFANTTSVNIGTPIRYKDVDIGEVVGVDLDKDYSSITATGFVFYEAEKLFRENSYIWLAKPKISLSGVENVGTVLRGPFLTVEPGSGESETEFDVQDSPPERKMYSKGLTVVLEANRPDSLKAGSPVYYRKVKVGSVLHIALSPDARNVRLTVGIDMKYAPLIREKTIFWNASGLRFNGGLMTEMKVSTESLEALITGGISIAIPEEDPGEAVQNSHVFSLLPEPTKGWDSWRPEIWIGPQVPKVIEASEKKIKPQTEEAEQENTLKSTSSPTKE